MFIITEARLPLIKRNSQTCQTTHEIHLSFTAYLQAVGNTACK